MAEIPDFFHAITAWRKFDTTGNDKLLTSAGMTDHVWPVADLGEAYCRSMGNHDAPQLECSCGFYCYKDRADAEQHAQGRLLAKVEIWGRLAEHARGYRAQHMKILELYVAPGFTAIDALTKRYNVAVFIDEGVNRWISENPYGSLSQNPWQNLSLSGGIGMSQSPYNPSANLYPPSYQNVYQQALAQYNQQSSQNQLNALQNAMALQNYARSSAIQLLGLAPKAPYVLTNSTTVSASPRFDVLYGHATVGAAPAMSVAFEWEEIEDDALPVKDAEIVEDPSFDPVAERVTRRLLAG